MTPPIIVKREFLMVKRSALIGFSQIFDRRCNDLERWLLEKGYKEKEVRKQALRGRSFCRDDLLNRKRTLQEKHRLHLI